MDFGDILDEWERQTAKPQGKKTREQQAPNTAGNKKALPQNKKTQEQAVDPITAWLRKYGVQDKDAEAEEEEETVGTRRYRLMHKKPDAVIDLHGLTQEEAWNALEAFFQNSRRYGFEKVLVIHGKGNHSKGTGVLKQTVKKFIERCPFTGESGHGNAASGGTGATWVFIKSVK